VVRREAVGAFLYGVAYRTAVRAREKAARRRAVETQVKTMPHPQVPPAEVLDWRLALDRELSLLPQKYRAALLLCDLEGRTRREAARQLGVPEGTMASRLSTARRMLARRLAQCGVTLSVGALAAALSEEAVAAVPARLVAVTVEAAALVAAGVAVPAAPAVALMNGVLRSMLMSKLKTCAAAVIAVALVIGVGIAQRADGQSPGSVPRGQAPAGEAQPVTELDLLRREVEILKLQMQLMQDKQRAQDAELRALTARNEGSGARLGSTLRGANSGAGPAGPAVQDPRSQMTQPSPDGTQPGVRGNVPPAGPYVQVPGGGPTLPPSAATPDKVTPPSAPGSLRSADPTAPDGGRPRDAGPQNPFRDIPFMDRIFTPPSRATREAPPGMTGPTGSKQMADMAAQMGRHAADQDVEAAVSAFRDLLRNAHDDPAKRRALDMMFKAMKELSQPREPGDARSNR
jgi:predicted DNA-binding protein (UPF0251 family)